MSNKAADYTLKFEPVFFNPYETNMIVELNTRNIFLKINVEFSCCSGWFSACVCVCDRQRERERERERLMLLSLMVFLLVSSLATFSINFLGKFTNLLLHSSLELPASKPNNSMDIYFHLNISMGISNTTC